MDAFLTEIYKKLDQDNFQGALTIAEQHEFDLLEQFLGETPSADFYQLLLLLTFACHEAPSIFHILKRAPNTLPKVYTELYGHYTAYHFKPFLMTLQTLQVPSTLFKVYQLVLKNLQHHVVAQLEWIYSSVPEMEVEGIFEKQDLLDRGWQFHQEEKVWYPLKPKKGSTENHGIEKLASLTNMLIQAETL
ncbi:hypothetical protein HMI54_003737 [Coelomomyces lativittatus]|nr:hypothetical protein HMI56_001309 [Coelomomyces lativittatus]KAJ1516899.1 hypothetical protein HMI55_001118 [Coelomomyces lativittatus]KAJ1517855.1 hypothetical protein HMI54_003737 [Coelomomyces lativittatus]